MTIEDIAGLGGIVKTIGSGIGKVYDDTISIPLNMRRIESSNGIELEITESGYKLKKNEENINFNDLEFDTQQDILKLKNQVGALNNLFCKLDKSLNSIEQTINKFNEISEADKLYLLEKYKYEDDVEKINTINDIISSKLLLENEFSRVLFDFIITLTKEDIINLGEIKKMLFNYSVVPYGDNNEIIEMYNGNKEQVFEKPLGLYFPYMNGDEILHESPFDVSWAIIQEYAYKGLYSESSMTRNLDSVHPGKAIYLFRNNCYTYLLMSSFEDLIGNIFLISNLGMNVFSYIPITNSDNSYVDFINKNKLLPKPLKNVSDKKYYELFNEMNI